MITLSLERIETLRDRIFRRNRLLQVKTIEESLEFINAVGFCFAFSAKNSELPCLWHAACGQRDPVMPLHSHHDPYIGLVWEAKDILPAQQKVYYGKVLKKRPTFISLEFFPFFYRLIAPERSADSYLADYLDGNLSLAARKILDALSERSPQITRDLKMASGMARPDQRYEFDQAMAELQMKMYILKIGEFYDPFSFLWDFVPNRFPKDTALSRNLSEEDARLKILQKYFQNLIASNESQIQLLFGWPNEMVQKSVAVLESQGQIESAHVDELRGQWFVNKKGIVA